MCKTIDELLDRLESENAELKEIEKYVDCFYKLLKYREEKFNKLEQEKEAYMLESQEGIEINAELKYKNEQYVKCLREIKDFCDKLTNLDTIDRLMGGEYSPDYVVAKQILAKMDGIKL